MNINDRNDKAAVRRSATWRLKLASDSALKKFIRAFVERAKERGYINSYSYHELHALIERIFLK